MVVIAPAWLLVAVLGAWLMWWWYPRPSPGRQPVPGLYLWRATPGDPTQRPGSGTRDLGWLPRALAVAAMATALADPRLEVGSGPALEVWVDDAPSLWSVEGSGTRRALAGAALEAARSQGAARDMRLRRLRQPERVVVLAAEADPATALAELLDDGASARRQALPAAMLLRPGREHWLLTDGADPGLHSWLAQAPVQRVLHVGEARRNSGVSLLSARRPWSPGTTGPVVLVRVHNASPLADERTLEIRRGDAPVLRRVLALPPGQDRAVLLRLGVDGDDRLSARLLPRAGEAIVDDDALTLALAPLAAVPLALHGDCDAAFAQALEDHPGVGAGRAGISVHCGAAETPPDRPGLWLRAGAADALPPGEATPSSRARRAGWPALSLAGLSAVGPAAAVPAGAEVVVRAGDRPLVLEHPGGLVEVRLGLAVPALVRRQVFPALVDALLVLALRRDVLDPIAQVRQRVVSVTPRPPAVAPGAPEIVSAPVTRSLWKGLLGLAAAMLLWDLLRTLGAGRRALRWRSEGAG